MLALVAQRGSEDLARNCARFLMLDQRVSQSRYAIASHLARQTPTLHHAARGQTAGRPGGSGRMNAADQLLRCS